MNLHSSTCQTNEQNVAVVAQDRNVTHSEPRIERCEFEELLQRAMEILNARDLKVQLKTTG